MKLLEKVRLLFMYLKICSYVTHISALEFLISYLSFSLTTVPCFLAALQMIQESNESISQMKNIESLVTLNAKVDFECRVSVTPHLF